MIRKLLAGLLLGVAQPAIAAEWREAETNHFRIYGSVDEKELRKFAERLEYFHGLLGLATGANETSKPVVKVRVFLVPSLGDVKRLYGAGDSDVAGFYGPRDEGAIAVVPRTTGDGTFTGQLVLFHEYAHHYMLQYTPAAYPSWYVEGFAEISSTASFERKGTITFGKAARHREYELVNGVAYPVAKMIDGSYIKDQEKGSGWNYGEAWVLSHYLTFTDGRRAQFRAYLAALNEGKKAAEAAKVFGDLGELQREVSAYLAGKSFSYRAVPIREGMAGPIAVRILRPAEVELIDMQVEIGRKVGVPGPNDKGKDETDAEFEKRVAAAKRERDAWIARLETTANRFAGDPAGWLLLADARCESEQYQACTEAADRALAIAPSSQRGLVRKAEAMIGLAKDLDPEKRRAQIKAARQMLLQANQLDSNDPLAFLWYYRSYAAMGQSADADGLLSLELVVELVPQIASTRLQLAREYMARRRYLDARRILIPLANSPHDRSAARTARAMLEEVEAKLESA